MTSLTSCGWEIDPELGNTIDRTRMLGTRFEVVEIGPAWPARVGFDPDDAPITEAMPGDRIRLEAMVVGVDGHAIAPESFDAIWLQRNATGRDLSGERSRCQDVEWTNMTGCEIGRGGAVEFEAPPIGPHAEFELRDHTLRVRTLAILALDEEITADECLALYQAPAPAMRRCGIVSGSYVLGPLWPLLALADEAGVPVDFPITEIPGPALAWPANRAPMPLGSSFVDYDTLEPIEGDPLEIHAGQLIRRKGPLWRPIDAQPYLQATTVVEGESYVFEPSREFVHVDWYSTASLRAYPLLDGLGNVFFAVRDDAEPGPATLVMVFKDSRESYGFREFEFEVVP